MFTVFVGNQNVAPWVQNVNFKTRRDTLSIRVSNTTDAIKACRESRISDLIGAFVGLGPYSTSKWIPSSSYRYASENPRKNVWRIFCYDLEVRELSSLILDGA